MKKLINNHKIFSVAILMVFICIGVLLTINLFNGGIQKDFKTLQQTLINPQSIEVLDAYESDGSSLFFISCSDKNGNEVNVYALVIGRDVYFDNEALVSAGLQERDAYKSIAKKVNSEKDDDIIREAMRNLANKYGWSQIDISMFKTK